MNILGNIKGHSIWNYSNEGDTKVSFYQGTYVEVKYKVDGDHLAPTLTYLMLGAFMSYLFTQTNN